MEQEMYDSHRGKKLTDAYFVGKYFQPGVSCNCKSNRKRMLSSAFTFAPKIHNKGKVRYHVNYFHSDPNTWCANNDPQNNHNPHLLQRQGPNVNMGLQMQEEEIPLQEDEEIEIQNVLEIQQEMFEDEEKKDEE